MIIKIYKLHLQLIYFFLKLFPINNKKITFLSRQVNSESLDFKMIRTNLEEKGYKTKVLCKRMNKGFKNYFKYNFHIYKQMYHIATSKVCVIDSYIIPISVLKHKKKLYVLQIWHSIGKIKKSGYQTLGHKKATSIFDFENNKQTAIIMKMHNNYDNIIAGGKAFDKFYCEGFNCKKEILLNYGLPRIDYLIQNSEKIKNEILNKYPEFKNKKVVLYVPTFRKYEINIDDLINNFDYDNNILIIKSHPNQIIDVKDKRIYLCEDFKSTDLLSISDYVITDYSSICLEAAILNKKVLFYIFDYEKYVNLNGLNLDPSKELKNSSYKNIEDILEIIKTDKYDDESYQKFRKQYLPENLGNSTELIVNKITSKLER